MNRILKNTTKELQKLKKQKCCKLLSLQDNIYVFNWHLTRVLMQGSYSFSKYQLVILLIDCYLIIMYRTLAKCYLKGCRLYHQDNDGSSFGERAVYFYTHI